MTTQAVAKFEETETENRIVVEGAASLSDQMKAAKTQFELAFGCYKQSVEHVWLMGQALTKAKELHKTLKKKNKSQPNWKSVLDEHGISVSKDYRATQVYKGCPNIEELQGRTIMEAYELVGITNSAQKQPATKSEVPPSETSSKQSSSSPADSSSDSDEEAADDEWPDIKESDLTDPDDDDFDDDHESDDANDTEPHIADSDLSDEQEDSKDALDDLDSLTAKAKTIQTSKVSEDDINEAFNRIDQLKQRLDEMTDELIARLKAKVLSERQSCGVVPSTV